MKKKEKDGLIDMTNNAIFSAVSFRGTILDCYKKLGLSENELVVILVIDRLLEQGNTFFTSQDLAMKMSLSAPEIDKIMAGLFQRNLITLESMGGESSWSIDNVKKQVRAEFVKQFSLEQDTAMNKELEARRASLLKFFEEKMGKTLSPLEKDSLNGWINADFTDEEIKDALIDAKQQGKTSIRAVDKILRNRRREEDIIKEGASGVSDSWDSDIEKTIEIAKSLWNVDDKE